MKLYSEKFKELSDEECRSLNGGHWIGDVLGAIGKLGKPVNPQQVVDQLNGKYPNRGPGSSCSPEGTGGTPNACNF